MNITDLQAKWNTSKILWDTWIAAMSTGRYPKGHGYLIRDQCYCALGVLVEISGFPGELSPLHHGAVMFDGLHSSVPYPLAEFMDMRPMGDLRGEIAIARTLVPRMTIACRTISAISDATGPDWPLARLAPIIDQQRGNLVPYRMRIE